MKRKTVGSSSEIQSPDLSNWERDLEKQKKKFKSQDEKEFNNFKTYLRKECMLFEYFMSTAEGKTFQWYLTNQTGYSKYTGLVPIKDIWKYREFDRIKNTHHSEEYDKDLLKSIEEKGITEAIILSVDRMGNVLLIEGNHRIYMAELAGMKYIPVRIYRQNEVYSQSLPLKHITLPLTAFNEWDLPKGWYYMKSDMQPNEIGLPQIDREKLQEWFNKKSGNTVGSTPMSVEDIYFSAIPYEHVDKIKMGEELAKQFSGSDEIITEISQSGNLIIRYIVSKMNIYFLGLVTVEGRILKKDLRDYNEWVEQLLEKLDEGYSLYSSPNQLTMPFMEKIISLAKKQGLNINKQVYNEYNFDGMEYKDIGISVSGSNYAPELTCYKLNNSLMDYYWDLFNSYFDIADEKITIGAVNTDEKVKLIDITFLEEEEGLLMIALAEYDQFDAGVFYNDIDGQTNVLLRSPENGFEDTGIDLGEGFNINLGKENEIKDFINASIFKAVRQLEYS